MRLMHERARALLVTSAYLGGLVLIIVGLGWKTLGLVESSPVIAIAYLLAIGLLAWAVGLFLRLPL